MERGKSARRVSIQDNEASEHDEGDRILPQLSKAMEMQEPFMGMKVRRRSSVCRKFEGDYLDVPSSQCIMKLLCKQGDRHVLFADSLVKVNQQGQIKRRIIIITDVGLYTLDSRWCNLKRRIALAAINRICMSELNDNFFAIIVPSEYDCLFVSTRKSEIVSTLVEATKGRPNGPIEVSFSNRFEYQVNSEQTREVQFEQVEGSVKTIIIKK